MTDPGFDPLTFALGTHEVHAAAMPLIARHAASLTSRPHPSWQTYIACCRGRCMQVNRAHPAPSHGSTDAG